MELIRNHYFRQAKILSRCFAKLFSIGKVEMSGFIVVKLQCNDKYRINKFIGYEKATSFLEKSRQIYIFVNFIVIRKRFWIYAL